MATTEGRSLSDIINDHYIEMLEDISDITEIEKRRGEPTVTLEHVLKALQK